MIVSHWALQFEKIFSKAKEWQLYKQLPSEVGNIFLSMRDRPTAPSKAINEFTLPEVHKDSHEVASNRSLHMRPAMAATDVETFTLR